MEHYKLFFLFVGVVWFCCFVCCCFVDDVDVHLIIIILSCISDPDFDSSIRLVVGGEGRRKEEIDETTRRLSNVDT